ncbi:MAG: DNA polymerase III subunit delta [Bacteroidetes bacterium]|nr:MAG: DNA polymerase III subunit delta [Bacteroidota bacterium]
MFSQIIRDIQKNKILPVYFLCGEEDYYIDLVTDYIENHFLEEGERDFNQVVLYGKETNSAQIQENAKRLPMMSPWNVVIIKEAQSLKDLAALENYFNQPNPQTILLLAYKYGTPDKRKSFVKTLIKNNYYFESKRLYDNQIPLWIENYLKERQFSIEPKAATILVEFLGNELSKISNELDKLVISLKSPQKITAKHIEENIGISKDFNAFELNKAIAYKQEYKAYLIAKYFAENPKSHPLIVTISTLFNFFSKLLIFHQLKDKSEKNAAKEMGVHPFFVKEYMTAARNFPLVKTLQIISLLKTYDLKSKGYKNNQFSDGQLLKELVYKILH